MHRSYAQAGQDLLLHYYLEKYRLLPRDPAYRGIYIDVGCNHPHDFSNTFHFYELGWNGICIDANPVMLDIFTKERPRDIAVACGVGREEASMDFYVFKNSQHSTFNKHKADRSPDRLEKVISVPVRPLKKILYEHNIRRADILSVDVEGFEMETLYSLEFDEIRPNLAIMEAKVDIKEIMNHKITKFMISKKYDLICHTGHDAIFRNAA